MYDTILVSDGGGYFADGCNVVSYNPGTFVLTLTANAIASSPAGTLQLGIQAPDLAGYQPLVAEFAAFGARPA